MDGNTDVDEIVNLPADSSPRKFGARYSSQCDLAIALAPRAVDFALIGGTGAKVRLGYTYRRRYVARATAWKFLTKLALSEADPRLSERNPHQRVRHEVDQLLDLVALAGAHERVTTLRVNVTDRDRRSVAVFPAAAITVHLARRWLENGTSLRSLLQVVRDLARFGRPLIVTSGKECAPAAARIRDAGVADAVADDLRFHEWAALFEKSACVVTVDTAATHLASAMRRPTVVVFEHRYFRLSSQEWAPYGVPSILLQKPANSSEAALAGLRAGIVDAVSQLLYA